MRKRPDDVEFVKTWLASNTLSEVAAKTGRTYTAVSAHVRYLREKGVQLPKRYPGKAPMPNVEELNRLINGGKKGK